MSIHVIYCVSYRIFFLVSFLCFMGIRFQHLKFQVWEYTDTLAWDWWCTNNRANAVISRKWVEIEMKIKRKWKEMTGKNIDVAFVVKSRKEKWKKIKNYVQWKGTVNASSTSHPELYFSWNRRTKKKLNETTYFFPSDIIRDNVTYDIFSRLWRRAINLNLFIDVFFLYSSFCICERKIR